MISTQCVRCRVTEVVPEGKDDDWSVVKKPVAGLCRGCREEDRLVLKLRGALGWVPMGFTDNQILECTKGTFTRKCIEFGLARDDFVVAVQDAARDDWEWLKRHGVAIFVVIKTRLAKLFNRR